MTSSQAVGKPRILIAAPASGVGKTTFTCGLLRLLMRRGLEPLACKCGPDYIDPMFHAKVVGAPSRNLDLFFCPPDQVRWLVTGDERAQRCDIVVIEGAMGFYDGIATSAEASAWDVARTTSTPALILVDGRGRALSVAAEVRGFAEFRHPSQVGGVVLNRVSASMYPRLKSVIEQERGVAVLGYVPALDDCGLESRHLGLVTADEVVDLRAKVDRIADALEGTLDVEGIVRLAHSAPALACAAPALSEVAEGHPVVAVARDAAFCFYYEDSLRALEQAGARLAFFSPLSDVKLPEGACGLYLGGGYPELHARELSENVPMLHAVRCAVEGGMPTLAECGGFLYLHRELEDDCGETWPLAGVLDARAFRTSRLQRFGYVTLTAHEDGLLCAAGEQMRAHEFHYWDSERPGRAFTAHKPQSERSWECGISSRTLYAGFPHIPLHAHPAQTCRFVEAAARYAARVEAGPAACCGEADATGAVRTKADATREGGASAEGGAQGACLAGVDAR